ncbi:MAG: SRPBCC family protein [Mycobacteriaceae bacterium]|nr:SRPBCC family protein [Mycobacteriaceae bacterium]
MRSVDVVSQVVIARPRDEVSTYAADPDNATAWYVNIGAAKWKTRKPMVVGSQFAFVAKFMARSMSYTHEVVDMDPGARLVMRTREGPFPMETIYLWEDAADGATKMTLRNRGEPSGFFGVAAPVIVGAMRRANAKDLRSLKSLLEAVRST